MKRGEVWLVNLDPRSGSEQRGIRPVLVLSND
ncbi:MAG: type II toxin-antitoxin system PemK/MazF family toxin, partial [Deinococcus sp.]